MNGPTLSRRGFLGGGALVVGFTLFPSGVFAQAPQEADGGTPPGLPKALNSDPLLESWIRIDAEGRITVFTGKSELGQGIRTALLQVAAEELAVDPAAITLVTSDTGRTPNESYTAGSQSMQESGTAILHASVPNVMCRPSSARIPRKPWQSVGRTSQAVHVSMTIS